ncbi:MAG: rRNA pseudouridine synthase [Caldilineales bacterium]|nr:rRNA pseudouridine synthase [Caldilineales bacterium]
MNQSPRRYLILHKPYNVLTQFSDAEGRPTLADYIAIPGVYAAGRLDQDSEGLLLLTDDGEMLHRVTHPHWKLPKTYLAQVEGVPAEADLAQLRAGVLVKGERTAAAEVSLLPHPPDLPPRAVRAYHPTPWLRITLREGRKRQVRRMTAAVGFPCLRLVRVAIGPLSLGDLLPGQWRDLSAGERQALFQAVGLTEDAGPPVAARPRPSGRQGKRPPRR